MHRAVFAYDACVFSGESWLNGWRVISCRNSSPDATKIVQLEEKRVGQKRVVLLSVDPVEVGPANPRAILATTLASIPESEKVRRIPLAVLAADVRAL